MTAAPRWFHWLGLAAVSTFLLALGLLMLLGGVGPEHFPGFGLLYRSGGVLSLAAAVLLGLRRRLGFRLAIVSLLVDAALLIGSVGLAYFALGGAPNAQQSLALTLLVLPFLAAAVSALRLQRAFVAG